MKLMYLTVFVYGACVKCINSTMAPGLKMLTENILLLYYDGASQIRLI